MAWYDLAYNPKAISEIYTVVPELNAIHILEIRLEERGFVYITMDLPSFPDKAPQRWTWQGYNAISLQLYFHSNVFFQLDRWSSSERVDFQINKGSSGMLFFRVDSEICAFEGQAEYVDIRVKKEIQK